MRGRKEKRKEGRREKEKKIKKKKAVHVKDLEIWRYFCII